MPDRPPPDPPDADHVARIQAQWAAALPDLDVEGSRILARARRITLLSRGPIEAVFARHGLDTGEFDVLATLRRTGPPHAATPTQLYRALMVSSGGLTARLDRLERRGLVTRRPDPEDGRGSWVELTPAGRTLVEAAIREDMAVETALVAGLSAEERDQLAALLARLAARLEAAEVTTGGSRRRGAR